MSVLVAMPCYTGIADTTGVGLFNLGKYFQANGIANDLLTVSNSSLISKCRSRIANIFLHATSFEYLLFIDSDIGFQVDDVKKLFELKVEFAAAPYPLKSLTPRYNFEVTRKDGKLVANATKTAIQIEHIGTGFMLIHRSVFEKVARHFPELLFYPSPESSHRAFTEAELKNSIHFFETYIDPISRVQLSEDLAFCRRARSVGVDIWMRLDTTLTHSGHHQFRGVDLAKEVESLL